MAYYGLAPFGEERADLRAGIVASTVANANRDATRRAQAFEPSDFMPQFGRREEEDEGEGEDWQRMLAMVEQWNALLGGDDLRVRG